MLGQNGQGASPTLISPVFLSPSIVLVIDYRLPFEYSFGWWEMRVQ